MTRNDVVRAAVETYFSSEGVGDIPSDVERLARLAAWDLWYGPIALEPDPERWEGPDDGKPWPGFVEACRIVSEWADSHVPDPLYVDLESGFA